MRVVAPALFVAAAIAGCNFAVLPLVADDAGTDDFGVGDLAAATPDGAMPRALGASCNGPGDCNSGACVDGVCCDSSCDPSDPANVCRACNVPGSEGHCAPVPPGTSCGSPSCVGGSITYAPACDGNGACVTPPATSCAPYACASATECATSCTPPANGCAPPAVCTGGSCGQRALGQPCAQPSDCMSNFCAPQGVCCNSACGGSCSSCDLPGKVGTCSPRPSGTACAPPGCMGDSAVAARTCDGAGTCQPATTTDCTPYTSNPGNAQCYARPCADNMQCAVGHSCNTSSGMCH
jgi:hypothetical protein